MNEPLYLKSIKNLLNLGVELVTIEMTDSHIEYAIVQKTRFNYLLQITNCDYFLYTFDMFGKHVKEMEMSTRYICEVDKGRKSTMTLVNINGVEGRGYGTVLMNLLMKDMKRKGITDIHGTIHPPDYEECSEAYRKKLIGFYEKFGFKFDEVTRTIEKTIDG